MQPQRRLRLADRAANGRVRCGVAGVIRIRSRTGARSLGLWGVESQDKVHSAPVPRCRPRGAPRRCCEALLDTDGWVERWGSVRFCSSSQRLARDVVEAGSLARRLVHGPDKRTHLHATRARSKRAASRLRAAISITPNRVRSSCSSDKQRSPSGALRAARIASRDRLDRAARVEPTHASPSPTPEPAVHHGRLRRHPQYVARPQHRRARGAGAEAAGARVLHGDGRHAARACACSARWARLDQQKLRTGRLRAGDWERLGDRARAS